MAQMIRLAGKRFEFGRLFITRGVNDKLADDSSFAEFVLRCLRRHGNGDWGDMSDSDKAENEFSIDKYLRLFSAYNRPCPASDRIWIITEADRSTTTVLFPDEY